MDSPGDRRMQGSVPYTIQIDSTRNVVRVLVSGVFDADEAPRMTSEARASARENGLNILYDIREARAGKLENSDIFWLPRTVPALKETQASRVRVATVFVECQRPIAEFWETAFRNVGLTAKAFEDEEAALGWLTAA